MGSTKNYKETFFFLNKEIGSKGKCVIKKTFKIVKLKKYIL